jgi:hypothetical protein
MSVWDRECKTGIPRLSAISLIALFVTGLSFQSSAQKGFERKLR